MVDPGEVMVMVMARGKLNLAEDMVVDTAAVDMEAIEEDMEVATPV